LSTSREAIISKKRTTVVHNKQKICGIKYIERFVLLWGRWRGYGFWRYFQQYFSYILAVSFIGGGLPGEILLGIQYLLSFLDNCSHWSLLFFMMRITKKRILAYRCIGHDTLIIFVLFSQLEFM
jgi:hypothetical protein